MHTLIEAIFLVMIFSLILPKTADASGKACDFKIPVGFQTHSADQNQKMYVNADKTMIIGLRCHQNLTDTQFTEMLKLFPNIQSVAKELNMFEIGQTQNSFSRIYFKNGASKMQISVVAKFKSSLEKSSAEKKVSSYLGTLP